MLNLSKGFRQHLAERFQIGTLQIASKQISEDGTVKYLFQCADGNVIESVLMYFEERGSYALCVSTQVGCAINCSFCATGKIALKRHLSASEIVEQYVQVQADSGKEIRNVVYMGQGEPLHNYENTVKSLRILNESCEVGMRRITVSTSGLVDHIDKLAEEEMPLTLALSLHAPNNEIRSRIMPINKRWPLETLIPSLERYLASTNRRLTMEYIMIDGINDQPEHAHQLGQLIQHLKCNINLIPYNPIAKDLPRAVDYKRSSNQAIRTFMMILLDRYHKKVTVRLERGVDIDAACGQLANRFQADKELV
jgi:23S rRNA (adenine2503-C2)-methyltransferase